MEHPYPGTSAGELRLVGRLHHGPRRCHSPVRSPLPDREGNRGGARGNGSRGRAGAMNRFAIPLGVFALLVVVLAIGIAHSPDKGTIISPLLGKPAPEFALPNLLDASQVVKSSDLKGR